MPTPTLNARQRIFEYCLDFNGRRAAIAAGYAPKSARVTASQLLTIPNVQAAVAAIQQERAERLNISADRVLIELARVAFSDIRDVMPRGGEAFDLHGISSDLTAAIKSIHQFETATAKRLSVTMCDKTGALAMLARYLSLDGRHASENSLEAWAKRMPREERLARIEELKAKGRAALYGQQQAQLAAGLPVISRALVAATVAVNDDGDERQWPGDLAVTAPVGS